MTKPTWVNSISFLAQLILGFLLGVGLMAGVAAGTAYFYFTTMSSFVPDKPIYEEEKEPTPSKAEKSVADQNDNKPSSATSETEPDPELPPNAYYARVTWSEGLSVRAEPESDAERIGGVGFNARIIILEDTPDKKWQKIRIPESQQEGWVKGGNTEKE